VQAILAKRGHRVDVAENGREAIERLEQSPYDLVLMDAQMPIMNGLQAAAAIRRFPNADRARVPIIAMTAHAMREDREKCLAAGMNEYLPKPVDAAELVRMVEKYGGRYVPFAARIVPQKSGEAMMSPSKRVLSVDLHAVLERYGGDRQIVRQMLALSLEESRRLVEHIVTALDENDLSAAALAAHNLRGVALNIDATPLAVAARMVENAAEAGNPDAVQPARQILKAELARVIDALANVQLPEA
jgi:CheY-like chemotaxis protein